MLEVACWQALQETINEHLNIVLATATKALSAVEVALVYPYQILKCPAKYFTQQTVNFTSKTQ